MRSYKIGTQSCKVVSVKVRAPSLQLFIAQPGVNYNLDFLNIWVGLDGKKVE